MTNAIAHRGPDGDGVWTSRNVGLGHRRLKIIDLSEVAKQPMEVFSGSLCITFNGEIYNYRELRSELEKKGYKFRSQSDTEVLVNLYHAEGVDCLQKLVGMFAFAIWDSRNEQLFIARDRMGQKPLFYTQTPHFFAFASEIKALFANPDIPRTPDKAALHHYLTFQYVPHPFSAFEGIRKLPHAHYLILRNGEITIERYWNLHYSPKSEASESELKEELLRKLEAATKSQMISDVPLGAFLSGGVDSSGIVAMMAKNSSRPVKTFSIGFDERDYTELPYARQVAELYKTEHHEFIVKPDAAAILPKLAWHYNEPFADSSAVPTWYLAEMTRKHVTVALNGDAGDENFCGYWRYLGLVLSQRFRLPKPLADLAQRSNKLISPRARGRIARYAKRFLERSSMSPKEIYYHWVGHFSAAEERERLLTSDFASTVSAEASFDIISTYMENTDAVGWGERAMAADINTYLPDDLLVKVDVATMAHSLEGRSPMLDHRFVEFAATVPMRLKLKRTQKKYLLREALRPLLPPAILDRPKQGFGVPIEHWFRGALKSFAYELLLSTRAKERGYFNQDYVRNLLDDHCIRGINRQYHIWNLLMFELWHRQYIDGEPSATRL